MQLAGQPFTLEILGADGAPVAETEEGHVGLSHREHYKLHLGNEGDVRAAFQITIDGEPFECRFVVDPGETWVIERKPDQDGLFTFYKQGSPEATEHMIDEINRNSLGMVVAEISRERQRPPPVTYNSLEAHILGLDDTKEGGSLGFSGELGFGAGGTGYSGYSSQVFAGTTFEDDDTPKVTLQLRLAHDPNRVLKTSTPVPPPIANDAGNDTSTDASQPVGDGSGSAGPGPS